MPRILIIPSAAMFDFQDEEQITIEQDSLRNKEDEEENAETHQKGYRFNQRTNHTDSYLVLPLCFILIQFQTLIIMYYLFPPLPNPPSLPPSQHHFQKN